MKLFELFENGAKTLAKPYGETHASVGITAADWKVLTQTKPWNAEQRSRVRSTLSECINASLTLAGLPGDQLPGQFVAALIAHVVSPANMIVAAYRAPDTYDAVKASGLQGSVVVVPMSHQMYSAK